MHDELAQNGKCRAALLMIIIMPCPGLAIIRNVWYPGYEARPYRPPYIVPPKCEVYRLGGLLYRPTAVLQ